MSEERTVQRGKLLLATLGFALLELAAAEAPPVIEALQRWLGTWTGIGLIAAGMARQGYDVSLARDDLGWRARKSGSRRSPPRRGSRSCGADMKA